MEKRLIMAIVGSFCGLVILWSCSFHVDETKSFLRLPVTKWHAGPSDEIPGGTGLKHCDDPDDDLYEMYRLYITPEHPTVGHNVSIIAMGRFKADTLANGTTFFFFVADRGALAGWGAEGFCNNTAVFQTVDSVLGPRCPPVKGHGLLRRDILINEHWPPGEQHVIVDVRNGTTGDSPRLFCVEGDIRLKHPHRDDHPWLRRTREKVLSRAFWI